MKQILLYVAVTFLTLYCYFFYESRIVGFLLVAEVIYFPMGLLFAWYQKRKISISMGRVIPLAEKNKEIPIDILVKNKSKLFGCFVKIILEMENSATGEKEEFAISCSARNGRTEKKQLLLKSSQSGILSLSVKKYWIYDLLYIFKVKRNSKAMQQVAILPESHLLMVDVTRKTKEFLADAEEYSDRESGDDSSEIYQIREFRDGDSIHDVHWKLTAKTDELRVKEYGRPLGCVVLIWLNLEKTNKKVKNVPSVLLEAVASLALSLLEKECVHMIAWYEPENKSIQKKRIAKETHIYELLNRLLYVKSYTEDVRYQYEEAFRGCQFSTRIEICTDGRIFVNEEEKAKLSLKDGEQNWDALYFIV